MPELQCTDQHSRHNLVADPQVDDAVKQVVAEPDSRRHRYHVATEQAQVHTGLALRHPVAHGGHAGGDLCGTPEFAGNALDHCRIVGQWLVGR